MRPLLLCAVLLASCAEYQAEPFLALSYRDEAFQGPHVASTSYEGPTLTIGFRYVPPTRISQLPPLRVDTLPPIYSPAPAPAPITVNAGEKKKGVVGELVDLAGTAKQADGSWDASAVLALSLLLAAFVALTIWMGKKRAAS